MDVRKLRLKEMVANSKINSLWNGYRINCYNDKLKEFFKNLETNNDLLLIFKGAERQNSIYGYSQMFFDIDKIDGQINLGVYIHNVLNQTLKIDGLKEYASVGVRQITRTKTGLVISVKELRTKDEIQVVPYSGGTSNRELITVDVFTVKNPLFIKDAGKTRIEELKYGVLSAKQFLNKTIIDFEINEVILKDTYTVEYLESQILDLLDYMEQEKEANRTRAFFQFANQDVDKLQQNPKETMQKLADLAKNGVIDKTLQDDYYQRYYKPSKTLSKANIFINAPGSGNKVDVMKGDYDQAKQTLGLNSLLELYFYGSGLDYGIKADKGGGQKTNLAIRNESRTTYDTIKNTNILRKAEITEFIERIMIANGFDPLELKEEWSFEIISNILQEEESDKEIIALMLENNLISQEVAIKRANPYMNNYDIEKMSLEIKKEMEEKKQQEEKEELEKNNNKDI